MAAFFDGFQRAVVVEQRRGDDVGYLDRFQQTVHILESPDARSLLNGGGIDRIGVVKTYQFVVRRLGQQPQVYFSQVAGSQQTYFQHFVSVFYFDSYKGRNKAENTPAIHRPIRGSGPENRCRKLREELPVREFPPRGSYSPGRATKSAAFCVHLSVSNGFCRSAAACFRAKEPIRLFFSENMEQKKIHKSGFVNIIGNPNVGKSTLLNVLVGKDLSIITSKAQTTRHRILGIVNGEDYQIVFSDTPGIIRPAYKLQESMMEFVSEAFEDADILLYMVEPGMKELKDEAFYRRIEQARVPVLLVVNKIDTIDQKTLEQTVDYWRERLPAAQVVPISATERFNVDNLLQRIVDLLPEGPSYYPEDALTDRPERFFVSEIIRQKILLNYRKEVPYSVEVVVEDFLEDDALIRIRAVIYVERESQRGILIGHRGESLKKTGTQARIDAERFFGKKIFLELVVKVDDGWRESERKLRRYGYSY